MTSTRQTFVRYFRSGPNHQHGTTHPVNHGGCYGGAPVAGDMALGIADNHHTDIGVASRDLMSLSVPTSCYGFRFFDAMVDADFTGATKLVSLPDGFRDDYPAGTIADSISPLYFYGGKVLTVADIEALRQGWMRILAANLLENMEYYGWDYVVQTREGEDFFQPFFEGNVLLQLQSVTV